MIIGRVLSVSACLALLATAPFAFGQEAPVILDEGGVLGGDLSSRMDMNYNFTCHEQQVEVEITVTRGAESKVRLNNLYHSVGPLSSGDRDRIQSVLDEYRYVDHISLRCRDDGTSALLITGAAQQPESNDSDPDMIRLFSFDQGRLVRVSE